MSHHCVVICLQVLLLVISRVDANNQDQTDFETYPVGATQQKPSASEKSKVDVLGSVLKRHVEALRKTPNKQVELVFLVDSSASVGADNFFNELKFVKKLLADFTVEYNATRVAVITFSSRNRVVRHVDHVSEPSPSNHKCSLLEEQLPTITYQGGGTYTLGAVLQAQEVLQKARPNAAKAVFLVTDGYSNGGDPRPAAKTLREQNVEIFTFGIQNGNVRELYDMASSPAEEHSYILNSFEEFEALARRALHEDLHIGAYLKQDSESCNKLCQLGESCCDSKAQCTCGTHTGHYACSCGMGYFGTGLTGDCQPCPPGTFKGASSPADASSCIPCPDANQISLPASTSADHCRCMPGYRKENNKCVALDCPILLPPENGYFVNEDCINVINAACGIRCDIGYKLKGSSIRLCAENGSWTGDDASCELKTCSVLNSPRHGFINCTTDNYAFETECFFSCQPGFQLIGSKKRTCLAISLWDGLPATCRPVSCPSLDTLAYGKIAPAKCTKSKSTFGDECLYECDSGFKLSGPIERKCSESGTWTNKQNISMCLDVQQPIIKCPEDIVLDTEENEASALVRWIEPLTTDNSDDPVVVTVVPAIVSPRRFDIGTASIVYTARDRAGNKANCSFTITVRDRQPPTVDRCISPPTFLSRVLPVEVSWEEPMFSDNSLRPLTVVGSHNNPLFLSLGDTEVVYEAKDEAGNNSTCTITISVQEHACAFPSDPTNGNANCSEADNGVYCSLTCQEGYGFALKTPPQYFCAYDGLWEPAEFLPFPDCSIMFYSNSISKIGSVSVVSTGLTCSDNFLLAQLEKHLERKISNRVSRICRSQVICEVENMIAGCDNDKDRVEEETNSLYRRRRSLSTETSNLQSLGGVSSHNNNSYGQQDIMNDGLVHNVTDFDVAHFTQSSAQTPTVSQSKIELEFQLTGKLPETSEEHDKQDSLVDSLQAAMNLLEDAANRGELDLSLGNKRLQVQYVRFDRDDPHFVCEPGMIAVENVCVKCPVGTYFNVVSEMCEACTMGTYQFLEGQFSCLVCPERTSTTTGQSKSLGECKAQCLPGTFSSTGLEPCETCPIGFFQPMYAQFLCLPCPLLKTTLRRGVRHAAECKVPCSPGLVSRSGLRPCFPCPDGYFQPHQGSDSCFKCPENLRTRMQGATNITACHGITVKIIEQQHMPESAELTINDCFSVPCHHGATCKALDIGFLCICVPGYTGIYCEKEIDECENNPCKNGGTCEDGLNSYKCFCPLGYSGEHCEEDIDDCVNEPCFNGATCSDQINGFHCQCAAGYVGPLCQYNVDECISNPCRNGGYCVDLIAQYFCECMPGFEGPNCEVNIDECEPQPCQNNATCKDDILHFRCECLPGFEGELCETEIDECRPDPCMNGATCLNLVAKFKCLCAPSFAGDLCETELSSDYILTFTSSGILDFVHLDLLSRPLTAVTVCMWMKTSDQLNYGTPLSYADTQGDNLLTLTDYSGFVFYVNMEKVVTDVTANDGLWHLICVTWSSRNGSWALYKDGLKQDGGSGLAVDAVIPATGVLILGQEQDRRGSGFSTPESFIGELTLLNIWDYVLDKTTIASFTFTCDNYRGNIRSWADFRSGIRGKVHYLDSHFCNGCHAPEVVPNGEIAISGVKTAAVASYECGSGHELQGSPSRRCLVSGDWSGTAPQCSRISCGFPGYIANGYINGRQYFYQDVIQYICNPGYHLLREGVRTCQSDNHWSGDAPQCEEILCDSPKHIENGKPTPLSKEYSLGQKVQFTCEDGYRLNGQETLVCDNNGRWNDSLPTCQPISCNSPPKVPHGHVIGDYAKLHVGSTVRYECDEGYRMKQSGKMYCEPRSKWTGELPKCERISCGSPVDILHGSIDVRDNQFGGTVIYKCDYGFELHGSTTAVCLANGTWSHQAPYCAPISCGNLFSPEYGHVEVPDSTFGNVAKYFCYTAYELQGVRSRKCRASGEWSGDPPTCIPVSCSQPESMSNGRYMGSDWTVGNTVTYSCNPGYLLKGEANRVCLETGHWLHQVPSCEPVECSTPPTMLHGSVDFDGRHFGQRATYTCDTGYQLVGPAIKVCMEDQYWGPDESECKPIKCGPPTQGDNVIITLTSDVYEGIASYSCSEGFRLEGPQGRNCMANGRWNGREPTCNVVYCQKPESVPHAYLINSDTQFNSVVEYYCDEGYKLVGPIQRLCNGKGEWDGSEPQCLKVICPIPDPLKNGDVIARDTFYDSVVTYSCHYGYELKGPTSRACLQEEVWSGADPECIMIHCPTDNLPIEYGITIGNSDTVGATVQYECSLGYTLNGNTTRTCQVDRIWSGNSPNCTRVQCAVPVAPAHMDVTWTGHSFEDTATYRCLDGYTIVGDSTRTCLANRHWSGDEPNCIPVKCEPPSDTKHGRAIWDSSTFGSHVEYKCDYGYRLKGSRKRTCKADRTWSEKEPKCQIITCIDPPSLLFGGIQNIKQNYVVGDEILYYCFPGFIMQQKASSVSCSVQGKWNGKLPTCKIVECPTPPVLQHGYVQGDNLTYGNTLHFICNMGWKLIGNTSAVCKSNGKWSAPIPSCAGILCPPPMDIDNGYVASDNFSNGAKVEYFCAKGYEIIGAAERTCQNDNTWSGHPPKCQPVICNQPQNVSHATIFGTSYEFGSEVSYVCDTGYELHGAKALTCTENRTWNSEPPVCEQISCPLPDPLLHGEIIVHSFSQGIVGRNVQFLPMDISRGDITVDGKSKLETSRTDIFRFGDTVTYRCQSGYKLIGVESRRCQQNSSWSDDAPRCNPVKCNAPEDLMMGDIEMSSLVYKSRINFTCGSGYKIDGSSFRECQADATWSFDHPKCAPVSCPKVQNIPHGHVKWSSLKYSATATYECLPGYKMIGPPIRLCDQSGSWSKTEPTCVARECQIPEFPDNGWLEAENVIVGSTATYYCNDGYELEGPMVRSCLVNQSWSLNTPKCKKTKCMAPPRISNGYFNGADFHFGAVVEYFCDIGFSINGSSKLKCLSNKMWNKFLPTCEPLPCPRPVPPAHGTVLFRTLQVGSTVHFSCKEGYKVEGPLNSTCSTDQKWSPNPPTCKLITCSAPKGFKNGKAIGQNFTLGSLLTFECNSKFKLQGSNQVKCTVVGNWSDDFPKCHRHICDGPPEPKNSHSPVGPYMIGQMIHFRCDKGYVPKGEMELRCDKMGEWQGSQPICSPVECGEPPQVEHSKSVEQGNRTFGAVITFVCDKGYRLVGDFVICNHAGEWTSPPHCEEMHCPDPPHINHSTVVVNKSPGVTEAIYKCHLGYSLKGPNKYVCLDNSTWHVRGITCEVITCSSAPSISYGGTSGSPEATVGSRIKYHCFPGYRMVGISSVECSWKGTWEGKTPHCVPISCPPPYPPEHGKVEGEDFSFQNAVFYTCNKGYQIFGRDTRFCLEDGKWSGEPPLCRRISCAKINAPSNGYVVEEKSGHFGDTIVFACHKGYQMVGNSEITCSDLGKWNREPPYCTIATCESSIKFPPHTISMTIMEKKFYVGERITFHCEIGFRQQGELFTQCLADQTWTEPRGLCKKVSCGRPKINSGAVLLGMSYLYKDNLVVVCPPGTKTKGKTILNCKENGEWNDKPTCEGMCSRPCLNGGLCIPPGLCSCPSGYVGDICQHAVCILPCLNGGTCIGPYNCKCSPGFSGTRCQTEIFKRRGRYYRG